VTDVMALRVLTYNVRHAAIDDGPDAWERRRPGVAARLDAADADVVGLQECGPDQHADVDADLPGYRWCGVAEAARSGENNPVGVGPRLSVRGSETAWLSESGSPRSVGWDAEYTRVLTTAHLRDGATGRDLTVFNTHFDHVGTRARVESATVLRERIDDLPSDRPAVVVGDLNAEPGRASYERLLDSEFDRRLRDARTVADVVDGPSTTLSDFVDLRPDRRIDHVLVTDGVGVERYAVDTTTAGGRFPSDHLPVVVDLAFADD